MSYEKPCQWCRDHAALNGGGAHPLRHIQVGDRQLCVDVEIADAVITAWQMGIETTNSCQAWGDWAPDLFPAPFLRRIDVLTTDDAERLAVALGLATYELCPTKWGHVSLCWAASAPLGPVGL